MIHLTMYEADGEYYLLSDRDGTLVASESTKEAVRGIEDTYADWHHRSYESSMSATLNYMFFTPSVVSFEDEAAIAAILGPPPWRVFSVRNVSGCLTGLKCVKDLAKPIFDAGVKPSLVKERISG